MDIKNQINMFLFMSIFIWIQIKFGIDINNNELLKSIRKHKKRNVDVNYYVLELWDWNTFVMGCSFDVLFVEWVDNL